MWKQMNNLLFNLFLEFSKKRDYSRASFAPSHLLEVPNMKCYLSDSANITVKIRGGSFWWFWKDHKGSATLFLHNESAIHRSWTRALGPDWTLVPSVQPSVPFSGQPGAFVKLPPQRWAQPRMQEAETVLAVTCGPILRESVHGLLSEPNRLADLSSALTHYGLQ